MMMKAEVFHGDEYRPADDEPFMNERQTEYFRRKLLAWKAELLEDSRDTVAGMKDQTRNIPDVADRASEETDRSLELRTRDRQRKLVSKIDQALRRIDEVPVVLLDDLTDRLRSSQPVQLRAGQLTRGA